MIDAVDELRNIQIISEGHFVDLDLPMANFQRDPDGVQEISARGRHSDNSVGFLVSLGSVWERQDVENSAVALYWGRAELVSVGIESDAFLRLLDEAYGTGLGHQRMRERVPFLAVSLAGDPTRLDSEPAKMKFFFESEAEERDAEFYVNIDVQAQSVQFHEKDTDYRRGVVLSLSAEA
jgi:hypothetical protein